MNERRRLVTEVLRTRTSCEAGRAIRTVNVNHDCWQRSTDVHEPHTRGRGGDILDVTNTLAICRSCHDWIHGHPADATRLGLLVSGHGRH